ncbi:MAG: hypothetical protein R3217_00985 [Gammaproteobacteria bacterium]|nr:hypothetical protein [Gammaproteobacteria bacterium]
MQRLLLWLSESPLRSGWAVAALALTRVLDIFGAALLAMISMRKGLWAGVQVALPALLLIVGFAVITGRLELIGQVAALWLPLLLLGEILRRTGSLPLAMQALVAMVGAAGAGWLLMADAPLEAMRQLVEDVVLPTLAQMRDGRELTAAEVADMARVMPAMLAASATLSIALALLLARFWQAVAWNPGGFGQDFRAFRMGRPYAMLAGLALGVSAYWPDAFANLVGLVMAVPLLLQGFALLHGAVKLLKLNVAVLWLVYLLSLPLTGLVVLVMVTIGALDNWTDLRTRLASRRGGE